MKSRTTLILVLVALVVGGVVVLDYYKGTTTEQAETKRKRILDIAASDITRLELVRSNQTIVLEKSGDQWEIKQPLAVRASASAVSSLLDELEFAERTRSFRRGDISATESGLEAPRLRLTVQGKNKPVTLLVGGETPTKDALYVTVENGLQVDVADKAFFDRFNKTLEDLRDRVVVDFVPSAATRLEIKSADRVIEVVRSSPATNAPPRWGLTRPLMARADQRKVSELLAALNDMRVADFVSDDARHIHTYHLDEPEREITVWTGDAGKTLLLDHSPTNDTSKVYAKLKSTDSIFTVPVPVVEKFAFQVNDLRDPQVLAFTEAGVSGIELVRGGNKTSLAREEGRWKLTAPVASPAEDSSVQQLLAQLGSLSVQQFTEDVATDLDKYGLAVPAITVTLYGGTTNVLTQLLVGTTDETHKLRYVKLAEEPFVYGVGSNIVDLLPSDHLSLRSLRFAELKPEQISKLTLRKPAGETVLERAADGKWHLVQPMQGVLDVDRLQGFLEVFAQLRAHQFLHEGQGNPAERGLDSPELTVTAVADGKTYALAVGKPADGAHKFVSWNDPPLVGTVAITDLATLSAEIVTPAGAAAPTTTNPTPVEVLTPPALAPVPQEYPGLVAGTVDAAPSAGLRIFAVKFLAKLLGVLLGLLLAAAIFCLAYLYLAGFPEFLKNFIVQQVNERGVAFQFQKMRLDLFRGVVASDAVLADARAPQEPWAQIDEIEFQWSWRRLIHRENPLTAIRIANAVISVPTPPDEQGPEKFTATDAYAIFRFRDDRTIEVDRLTGVYCGIRLFVTGRFKPLAASAAAPMPASPEQRFRFVTKAVRELKSVRVTRPPQLDLDLDIDAGRPLEGGFAARLSGYDMLYRGLAVDSALVNVEMRGGAIEIQQATAKLYGGDVSIKGRYDIAMSRFDLQMTSSTDPTAFAAVLPPKPAKIFRELHVRENPNIVVSYSLSPETGSLPQLTARVETSGLDFRGVDFSSIKFTLESKGPEVKFSYVSVVTPEGRLVGSGQYDMESTDFNYEIDTTLDPTKLLPIMTPQMRRIVEPARFETSPHIIATVSGDFVDPDAFAYDAQLSTERCSYRGVALNRASAMLRLRQSKLDVQDMVLIRPEGQLRGTLLADFNEHRVQFDIETTANPTEMAGLLGEKAARIMKPYRFGPITSATAAGLVDFTNETRTAWTAQVANNGFSCWKLTTDRARAQLVFTNSTLQINDFDADFYDGKLRGRADFAFGYPDVTYRFKFNTERVDVNKLLYAMRDRESKITGFLTGSAELKGKNADWAALEGTGNVEVTDGILWEAPIFGIFSRIVGNTKVTSAKASFAIANETVTTDDLRFSAGAFTGASSGKLKFDGSLDFHVEGQFLRSVPLLNIPGIIIGKILEYKVGGSLSDPGYRAVNLPKELLPHD
jgi:hypothetical protein